VRPAVARAPGVGDHREALWDRSAATAGAFPGLTLGLEPTPYSVRSPLASERGSGPALDAKTKWRPRCRGSVRFVTWSKLLHRLIFLLDCVKYGESPQEVQNMRKYSNAAKVEAMREERVWSQEQLAPVSGVSVRTI
jgi:hypothetical protein